MKKSFGILICFMIGAGVLHAADDAKQPGNPLEDVFTGEAKASPAGTTSTAKQATRDWTARGFIIPPPPPVGGVYDDTLPKNPGELTVKPFEGERYAAEVPATIDLAEYASRSVNFLTRLISPEATDYCVYHFVHLDVNPPILEVGHMSTLAQNAKWSEAIVLMRAMSGNNDRLSEDRKLIGSLVRITGNDLIFRSPSYLRTHVSNRRQGSNSITCEKTSLPAFIGLCASEIRHYRPIQIQIDAGHGFS